MPEINEGTKKGLDRIARNRRRMQETSLAIRERIAQSDREIAVGFRESMGEASEAVTAEEFLKEE